MKAHVNNKYIRKIHKRRTFKYEKYVCGYSQKLLLAEVEHARASGAPWVRKFGKLSIQENLVVRSAYPVRLYTLRR